MQQLFRSVHLFSGLPIVVVHFGMSIPQQWDPERFPRLIILHAEPLPHDANKRSFNFNKYRAMMLAQVRTGVELDSDEFVAPGVDAIFLRTEEEVTEKYPMPILPAHFLPDKGPEGGGIWWPRYCKQGERPCVRQTMRWGHAHPTWTYWALPFLGRWLRRNLRDETLPGHAGYPGSALKVSLVPEDEDLLNVGLWEEGATKQWCKFETPDPMDFNYLMQNMTTQISADKRFYPDGAPLVFYTAHHAVRPDWSERIITNLLQKHQTHSLPPPIAFYHKFYKNGQELRRHHPHLACLI